MGTSLTPVHKLIKPDDVESIDVDQFNSNWDNLETAIPVMTFGGMPAGKTPKIHMARHDINTGAGGEDRTANYATNANGEGGFWFGYNGYPKFEGISSVILTPYNQGSAFDHFPTIVDYNTTRVKFRSRKYNGTFANNYNGISFHIFIAGW